MYYLTMTTTYRLAYSAILAILLLGLPYFAQASEDSVELIKLTHDNFVTIRGPINSESASRVINELLSNEERNIYVYINSNGGSVVSGGQIIQTIRALQASGKTINCIANTALSMGFAILQSCSTRLVLPSSVLMQHQVSLGIDGNLRQVDNYLTFVKKMNDELDVMQSNRLGMTLQQFKELCEHDIWLYGSDALTYKAADRMVLAVCNFIPKTYEETISTFFGDIVLKFSSCPLSTSPLKITFSNPTISKDDKDTVLQQIYKDYMISSDYVV